MTGARRALPPLYYGGLALLLALVITGTLDEVLPQRVARHVGENSEGLFFALLLPAWVQAVRPRLRGTARERPVTAATAGALLVAGLVCYLVDGVPPRVATLNEPLLALAVLVPYVQLPRPVPRGLALGLPAAVLLLVLVASGTALVTDLAEGLGFLVLAPLALDVVDRSVLEPERRVPLALLLLWFALLVLAPAAVSLLDDQVGGVGDTALDYAVRVQESYVGVLLSGVYLALLRARRTPPAAARLARPSGTAARGVA